MVSLLNPAYQRCASSIDARNARGVHNQSLSRHIRYTINANLHTSRCQNGTRSSATIVARKATQNGNQPFLFERTLTR